MIALAILAYVGSAVIFGLTGFALGWIIMGAMLHGLT